jgi:hypothetical protein
VRVGTLTEAGVEIDHGDGVRVEMALGDPELARRAPHAARTVAEWLGLPAEDVRAECGLTG